jgi:hypothetical protein
LGGSGNQLARNNIRTGFGVGISSSDRRNAGGASQDAVGTTVTDGEEGDESCVRVLNTSGALAGALDVVSMDSGGFTLVVDTQFGADLRVQFLAFGGDHITNYKTGLIDEPAATGNQATTGLGFMPDMLLMFTMSSSGTPPTQAAHHSCSVGFAARGSNQFVCIYRDRDANGTTDVRCRAEAGVVGRITFNAEAIQAKASVNSFDADGFTLNWTARSGTGVNHHYFAVKGGLWAVNTLTTQTDTSTTTSVTGLATPPVAALFLSLNGAQDAFHLTATKTVGAAVSASDRGCSYMLSQDSGTNSATMCGQRTDAVYMAAVHNNPTATLRALMDVQSFNSDGLTCIMDDAEVGNGPVYCLTFGSEP